LRGRGAFALGTRSRLRQSRQLTLLREDDTTSWFHPLSRPRKKSKYAANVTATVHSGIRCDRKTRHRSHFVPSFSRFGNLNELEDKKRSAVEDGIRGKNQFHETELATSLFELEQGNVARRGTSILWTNRPTGFVHEHYLGWQPRAASTFFLILLRFSRQRARVGSKVSSRRNILQRCIRDLRWIRCCTVGLNWTRRCISGLNLLKQTWYLV